MPFGSFTAQARTVRPAEKKKPAQEESGFIHAKSAEQQLSSSNLKLHILLIGRNLSIIQEFLCSMNQNMSEVLSGEGMSYYTRELDSISDIVARKKSLEQFFWNFSQDGWEYPQDGPSSKTYIFSISPSGCQSRVLDFVFHCVTPDPEVLIDWEQTDAVWFLTDGLLLSAEAGSDSYFRWIQDVLSHIPEQAQETGMPVCLILSQIEKLGHFDDTSGVSVLPDKVLQKLTALCQEHFMDACSTLVPAAMFPVQVYGGLECTGMDPKGDPVLHISQSGFYQSYIPDNCQIPGLYTLQTIAASRQMDFFAGMPNGSLLEGIRHHYSVKFGNPAWTPVLLKGRDGHEG